jgi:uncharacterized RDD family membrane protein YckC
MQAAEARAALRVAETATRAALEAQAAAQVALANLQIAEEEERERAERFEAEAAMPEQFATEPEERWQPATRWKPEPEPVAGLAEPAAPEQDAPGPGVAWKVRWEPDFPTRSAQPQTVRPEHQQRLAVAALEEPEDGITTVDAQPIHANVIHFPREIVATRRMRPRLGVPVEEAAQQLSIFEVDPSTVSTEPMVAVAAAAVADPAWAGSGWAGSGWSGPEWSGIELGAHPQVEREIHHEPTVGCDAEISLAPLESRLLAAAVDLALIVVMACAAVWGIGGHMVAHPTLKFAETSAVAGFIMIGLAYQVFFLLTAKSTPGMMYAGIALCTFDDEYPTPEQLRGRLVAVLISLLPVGLGLAWSIFDEDHLSWHDRLSRTYQRKC